MNGASFWRELLLRVEEQVADGLAGKDLHWAFRARLGTQGIEQAEAWLWKQLWNELRRRRLVDSPGLRLGPRFVHYAVIDEHDEDLRTELLEACFERTFSGGRIASYVNNCANPEWNPDVMIRRNLVNQVHELQQGGDPGGTALFDGLLRAAALPELARGVQFCESTRTLTFGAGGGALEPDVAGQCFEHASALTVFVRKLEQRLDEGTGVQLRGHEIAVDLARGLSALGAESNGTLTVDDLVRALRPALPKERRAQELHADEEHTPDAADQPALNLAGLGERALELVARHPGLQARTRGHLSELLHALIDAARDGRDPDEAARALGWPKQSLSDRRRRLHELLESELSLPAGAIPITEATGNAR